MRDSRLAHQRKVFAVRIRKLGKPKFDFGRAMDYMRAGLECNPLRIERLEYGLDVSHLEIDSASSLTGSTGRRNANEQPHPANLEKCHLRRSGEQKWQAKSVAIKADRALEIRYGNHHLRH